MSNFIQIEGIEQKIYFVRGRRVMLDKDLAALYQVKPTVLRQQVKRNSNRFPLDFMFQLNESEVETMVSQNVIPSHQSLGGHFPYVFTQEGVAMLSGVLHSERAIQVNITIVRAFVRMRGLLLSNKELYAKFHELEKKYDSQFKQVFEAIYALMKSNQDASKPKIGFDTK